MYASVSCFCVFPVKRFIKMIYQMIYRKVLTKQCKIHFRTQFVFKWPNSWLMRTLHTTFLSYDVTTSFNVKKVIIIHKFPEKSKRVIFRTISRYSCSNLEQIGIYRNIKYTGLERILDPLPFNKKFLKKINKLNFETICKG